MIDYIDLLDKPFKNGGRGPDAYDCYGLGIEIFRRYGIQILDYKISCMDLSLIDATIEQEQSRWRKLEKPLEPCLIVMRCNSPRYINHAGVYIGKGRFIHTTSKAGVRVQLLNDIYYKDKIEGFYIPKGESNDKTSNP